MTHSPAPVLTIDGPAGAGKGTIGQRVALALGWHYLDSGALYRVAAYVADQHGLTPDDVDALVMKLAALDIETRARHDASARIRVNGEDISARLRTPATGRLASQFAQLAQIRSALMARQQQSRQTPGLVADGRDMGTVVFPDALVKIYLTASLEERAKRRHKQLMDKGLDVNLARLVEEMRQRDQQDRERAESPLKAAGDAVTLDATCLTIEQVIDRVLELVGEALRNSGG